MLWFDSKWNRQYYVSPMLWILWHSNDESRRIETGLIEEVRGQCDQVGRLFVQYLADYDNENLPRSPK